LSAIVIKLLKF